MCIVLAGKCQVPHPAAFPSARRVLVFGGGLGLSGAWHWFCPLTTGRIPQYQVLLCQHSASSAERASSQSLFLQNIICCSLPPRPLIKPFLAGPPRAPCASLGVSAASRRSCDPGVCSLCPGTMSQALTFHENPTRSQHKTEPGRVQLSK